MYKVKTMNAIAQQGLDILTEAGLEVSPEIAAPEGMLIRSAALHDMEFNKELLCISRAGIGVDNIPIDRCTEAGIAVFNTPGANAESVKELLVCALMMASRDVIGAIDWVRSLAGQGDAIPSLVEKGKKAFIGPEISGKKLGVIGLGTIGAKVANIAQKLDMEVYGYDPYLSVASAWNLSSKVKRVTDLDMMLRTCDYITMHIHYTPQTRHYLNAEHGHEETLSAQWAERWLPVFCRGAEQGEFAAFRAVFDIGDADIGRFIHADADGADRLELGGGAGAYILAVGAIGVDEDNAVAWNDAQQAFE